MGAVMSQLVHWCTHWTKEKAIAVGIPFALGSIVGAAQAKPTAEWWPTLRKPSWCPPAPVFGQVWSVLYIAIGYASYLVWQHGGWAAQKRPLQLYAVQLVLNLLWPITFFIRKQLGQAQIVNLTLLAAAAATAREFAQVDPLAGKIFVPYLIWIAFANLLNYSVMKLNPGAQLPSSVREDNFHDPSKKNPGEQGYGPGGATTAAAALGAHRSAQLAPQRPRPCRGAVLRPARPAPRPRMWGLRRPAAAPRSASGACMSVRFAM